MLRARSAVFIAIVVGNTGAGPSLFNAGVPGDRALPARPVAEAILEQTTAAGGGMRTMSASEYEDRIRASWYGQIAGTLMGFAFEHRAAAAAVVDTIPDRFKGIPVDDDWYYEMVAVRAFERFGIIMTAAQLGEQWKLNNAGSWGSSEQARLLLAKGRSAPDTGHPRYNRLWFSIGPQFSADVYGMIAPGMPNTAGRIAREYGHVNGYAEGADGAVFMAGMVSLAFVENDPREIVRKAAELLHPRSPYREALDLVITMADAGSTAEAVAGAVEDRWHLEYPATNNAVANGALVAMAVWFGGGDWLKTVNLAFRAADFTDADCNAANAGAVIGALKGTKGAWRRLDAQGDIGRQSKTSRRSRRRCRSCVGPGCSRRQSATADPDRAGEERRPRVADGGGRPEGIRRSDRHGPSHSARAARPGVRTGQCVLAQSPIGIAQLPRLESEHTAGHRI
jgi:hypothetical protein